MKRPFLVWIAFAACALVGCGVLAWFTREMLRLDHESTEARRLAAVEENIRLALWRMDSALANVHGAEASRPAQEYSPFFRAHAAYGSDGRTPLPAGTVLLPSPLLGYTPPFVKLHFQVDRDGRVGSPQAPTTQLRDAALASGVTAEYLSTADSAVAALRSHLSTVDLAALLPPVPVAPFSAHALAKKDADESYVSSPLFRKVTDSLRSDDTGARDELAAASNAPAPAQAAAPPVRNEEIVQRLKSEAEGRERANTLELQNRYNFEIADNRRVQSPVLLDETLAVPVGNAANENLVLGDDPSSVNTIAPGAASARQTSPAAGIGGQRGAVAPTEADAPSASERAASPVEAAKEISAVQPDAEGSLQAVWIGDELLLARRAVVNNTDVVQGAWLDWPELRAWLLSRTSDLLPAARLEPVSVDGTVTSVDAARRLAFLPVQLAPGAVRIDGRPLASPLRISIAIAWAGAAIGLLALALLLRGTVRLSERRGAFVSAVTHELRTPLTTFRMYTEMLASGMVKDEAKRQGYVETLHQESTRLSHLVENVLSYARLERGRAAARVEDTTPGELLARIEERLRQRAQQGGLSVTVAFVDGVADTALRTDTTAVEQVLFNLVDNATKYGRRAATVTGPGEAGPGSPTLATARADNGTITISIALAKPDRLAIRVGDQGPGLTPAARKRLFQPFSKSATEAAHSQPGVGLGLALCRRLARDELHGELALERTGADGTVFRLELPVG